ncbi:hypothetical protein [Pseudoduganella violaceinigra]|uniref:hypothetical protein n=1 Tax=Pseudoduganella violaceinigra TaxID=246602 RepID=UPI00040BF7C4|nr:hypothetical protein [Pseudoduganella violaceinigra]
MQNNFESIAGCWELVGSTTINSEIAFVDDEPDPDGIADWLNGVGDELEESLKSTSGMKLEVAPDGRFSEHLTGQPSVTWFDVEGVLCNSVVPFNGALRRNDEGIYLQPDDIPSWSEHLAANYGNAILRYDDGDTKISDFLRMKDGRLLRTVNVVTDELYTDRVLIAYARCKEER